VAKILQEMVFASVRVCDSISSRFPVVTNKNSLPLLQGGSQNLQANVLSNELVQLHTIPSRGTHLATGTHWLVTHSHGLIIAVIIDLSNITSPTIR
jgi:hypothetical protein